MSLFRVLTVCQSVPFYPSNRADFSESFPAKSFQCLAEMKRCRYWRNFRDHLTFEQKFYWLTLALDMCSAAHCKEACFHIMHPFPGRTSSHATKHHNDQESSWIYGIRLSNLKYWKRWIIFQLLWVCRFSSSPKLPLVRSWLKGWCDPVNWLVVRSLVDIWLQCVVVKWLLATH